MDRRTSLCKYAQINGIDVDYFPMHSVGAFSIPVNGSCAIAIDPSKVESLADETVKIAHELGHCKYGGFYCRHSPLDIKDFEVTEAFLEWAIEYYTERKGYSFK